MRTDPSEPRLAPEEDPRFTEEAPLSLEEHAADAALVPGAEPIPRSNWQLFRRRFFRHKLALISIFVLIVLIIMCFGAKWIAPYPKNDQHILESAAGPSAKHWMGTDDLGRDQYTEILYAGQVSLTIGLVVAFLATVVGVFVGAVAGFFAGLADQGLSRLTDLFLVLPEIAILAVVLKALGQSPTWIIVVLAALGWMYVARVVRGQVLSIKEKEYVEAARASGASNKRIILRHIIPNTIGPIMVNMTLAIAAAIIAESTLSFLGFGIQPPDNSWGRMLADAEPYTTNVDTFYRIFFPGLMILITVIAVNFLGDGLRDAFDAQGD
jgi:peptide/nickel transport system permease protein